MTDFARVTAPLLDVLEVLNAASIAGEQVHGWAIIKATRRTGPTIYGILDRLEDAGWVAGHWEQASDDLGRPRRRLYELTGHGVRSARELLAERRPRHANGHPGMVVPGWSTLRSVFAGGAR